MQQYSDAVPVVAKQHDLVDATRSLFLGPILLAVVLEPFVIYQDEYQQQGGEIFIGATKNSRDDLRTAHELADKTL